MQDSSSKFQHFSLPVCLCQFFFFLICNTKICKAVTGSLKKLFGPAFHVAYLKSINPLLLGARTSQIPTTWLIILDKDYRRVILAWIHGNSICVCVCVDRAWHHARKPKQTLASPFHTVVSYLTLRHYHTSLSLVILPSLAWPSPQPPSCHVIKTTWNSRFLLLTADPSPHVIGLSYPKCYGLLEVHLLAFIKLPRNSTYPHVHAFTAKFYLNSSFF